MLDVSIRREPCAAWFTYVSLGKAPIISRLSPLVPLVRRGDRGSCRGSSRVIVTPSMCHHSLVLFDINPLQHQLKGRQTQQSQRAQSNAWPTFIMSTELLRVNIYSVLVNEDVPQWILRSIKNKRGRAETFPRPTAQLNIDYCCSLYALSLSQLPVIVFSPFLGLLNVSIYQMYRT